MRKLPLDRAVLMQVLEFELTSLSHFPRPGKALSSFEAAGELFQVSSLYQAGDPREQKLLHLLERGAKVLCSAPQMQEHLGKQNSG